MYEVRFYDGRGRFLYADVCGTREEALRAAEDRRPEAANKAHIVAKKVHRTHRFGYEVCEWAGFATFIRVARKQHICCSVDCSSDPPRRCSKRIMPGEPYVEYCGESPPYQSGERFHLECAEKERLVRRILPDAAKGISCNAAHQPE